MKPGTAWRMLGGWKFPSTLRALKTMTAVHHGTWLAAASRFGILAGLADGPRPFADLAEAIVPTVAGRRAAPRRRSVRAEGIDGPPDRRGRRRVRGPLPTPDEIVGYLRDAGLSPDAPRRAMPGEELYAITGRRPRRS